MTQSTGTAAAKIPFDPAARTPAQQAYIDSLSCPHGRTWYWARRTGCCR